MTHVAKRSNLSFFFVFITKNYHFKIQELRFNNNINRNNIQSFCVACYENKQIIYLDRTARNPVCATIQKPRYILHVAVNMAHIVVKRRSIQRIATAL